MAQWHLAQLNVGHIVNGIDSPELTDFKNQLDEVNALAESSPGFVWRLKSDSGNATDIQVSDDPLFIVNMSVWESPQALFDFVYRSAHTKVMVRRREWFRRPEAAYQVLWWVPAGHQPSTAEAMEKLKLLQEEGPGPGAFTFKERYPAPDEAGGPRDEKPEPYCVGWN